jgi:hypothetical protein
MAHIRKEDKILEVRRNPSKAELNWFGLMFLGVFTLVGFVFWGKGSFIFGTGSAPPIASWVAWSLAASVFLVYYAVPPLRKRIYVGFILAVYPIGFVFSHVILGAMFYLLFTPIGLIMKVVGYDPLDRRFEPEASTYWKPHRTGDDPSRYLKQF